MSVQERFAAWAPRYPMARDDVRTLVTSSQFLQADPAESQSGLVSDDLDMGSVVVMGAFDGLHRGHRMLVDAALEDARRRRLPCVALTFDPDPSVLLDPGNPQPQLLSVDDRMRGLRQLGVSQTVALPFTRELASSMPERFVTDWLLPLVKPVCVHVGTNFHFGARGAGTAGTLRALGCEHGFEVVETQLLELGGSRVSSTRVRDELARPEGLAQANDLLARCHYVRGTIVHGRGEGTSFGFPTANVRCDALSCMPCQGVYAGFATIEGVAWPAAINVGAPPSFSAPDDRFLEANLIGFEGSVYGASACVTFVEWLRPSRVFDSLGELERVVLGNIDWVRTNLGESGVRLP